MGRVNNINTNLDHFRCVVGTGSDQQHSARTELRFVRDDYSRRSIIHRGRAIVDDILLIHWLQTAFNFI